MPVELHATTGHDCLLPPTFSTAAALLYASQLGGRRLSPPTEEIMFQFYKCWNVSQSAYEFGFFHGRKKNMSMCVLPKRFAFFTGEETILMWNVFRLYDSGFCTQQFQPTREGCSYIWLSFPQIPERLDGLILRNSMRYGMIFLYFEVQNGKLRCKLGNLFHMGCTFGCTCLQQQQQQ